MVSQTIFFTSRSFWLRFKGQRPPCDANGIYGERKIRFRGHKISDFGLRVWTFSTPNWSLTVVGSSLVSLNPNWIVWQYLATSDFEFPVIISRANKVWLCYSYHDFIWFANLFIPFVFNFSFIVGPIIIVIAISCDQIWKKGFLTQRARVWTLDVKFERVPFSLLLVSGGEQCQEICLLSSSSSVHLE